MRSALAWLGKIRRNQRRKLMRLTAFRLYWTHEITAQRCAELLRQADEA